MKTEIEMAGEGEFLREYGKQYFVVVSEALSIGRVKWNMVPIGKSGQGDITFYLTTEQMLDLCSEILSGRFATNVKNDNGQFPQAYSYMTGADGSLHLAIGGGNAGTRVQMRNTKATPKALNYTMGVSMKAWVMMARKYMLCTGMTTVVPGSYYESVIKAFEAGRAGRAKFRKPTAEELGDVVDNNNVVNESAEPKTTQPAAPKPAPKQNAAPDEKIVIENFDLMVHGERKEQKGFFVFDAKNQADNATVSLMFKKDDVAKQEWFTKFTNAVADKETPLKIRGEKRKNFVLYHGPQKKQ